jgi:hypothetical protein
MSGPDPKASERQPSPIPAALTALRAYRVGEVLTLHEETREALALIGPRRGLKLTYYARELSSVGKNDEEGMRRAVARARAFAAVLWGYGWSTLRMDYCGACEARSVLEIIGKRSNP